MTYGGPKLTVVEVEKLGPQISVTEALIVVEPLATADGVTVAMLPFGTRL